MLARKSLNASKIITKMHNIYQMLLIMLSFEWLPIIVYKLAGAGSRSSLNGILTDKFFDSFPACLGLSLPYVELSASQILYVFQC